VLTISSARRLRLPGYLIMATLIVLQIIDVGVGNWPFSVHSPTWRLGFIATSAGAVATPLIALLVVFAIAVATDHEAAAYLVALVSALAAALCVVAAGVFSLDVLRLRNEVRSGLGGPHEIASMWVAARVLVTAALLAVLMVSAWRAAKAAARHRAIEQPIGRASWLVSPVHAAPTISRSVRAGAESKS
jgi:hypothetical protein